MEEALRQENLIEVNHLMKYFKLGNEKISKAKAKYLHAVDDVSFTIKKGEIFGIIGESGSGKSTIGKCILRLIDSDSGEVFLNGKDVTKLSAKELKAMRSNMQMVFQNPLASFNPKKKLGDAFREYANFLKISKEEYEKKMGELLDYINLSDDVLSRLPKELSGGQLQRLAFARAILSEPDFLLADEPVSALDVSVQAQILNLMLDLKEKKGQTMLFISHDLNVVKHICERVAVVYLGVIVEMGDIDMVYNNTKHPYTQALISAKPKEHPLEEKERIILEGDVPNAINVKEGCRFASRCVRYKNGLCDHRTPKMKEVEPGHYVACHYA
ncbi:MAG: ABC transporter ATP-binding protein [Eubacterium sp.]|nr:ABC transporter ATP-binding protein [Eubacterium sp.]